MLRQMASYNRVRVLKCTLCLNLMSTTPKKKIAIEKEARAATIAMQEET